MCGPHTVEPAVRCRNAHAAGSVAAERKVDVACGARGLRHVRCEVWACGRVNGPGASGRAARS
eukprot:351286-Chlamydomonas_euryale.AAC.3